MFVRERKNVRIPDLAIKGGKNGEDVDNGGVGVEVVRQVPPQLLPTASVRDKLLGTEIDLYIRYKIKIKV